MFGRLYHLSSPEARTRADELLERFQLDEAADRVAKTYSGGMRRRLDLAAALIGRPRVLFLDEPTTGLDPRGRLGMWDVIRTQVREGATLLLTTQYLEEADELANEIAVVDKGKIIARGTVRPAEVAGRRRADRGGRARASRPRARRAAARARRDGDDRGAHAADHDRGRRRRGAARRRRARARRGRDQDRRHRAAPADARRRLPRADRPRRPRSCRSRRRKRHDRAPRGDQRRPDHDLAEPEARAADPGARDLRDPPVDHVRAAVRVRLRRRDPAPGRRLLPRVPDAGHLRPDARLRLDHDRDRGHRRHGEGPDRPLPLAADGALGGAQRPHGLGRDLQRRHPRRADAVGPRRRLAGARQRRRLLPRRRADALLHLRDGLDRRPDRAAGALGGGRAAARLPDRLPADVRLERVRPDRDAAELAPARSPSGTRSARSPPRRATSSATRTRSRRASRATTRSCSRSSGRSRCSSSSRRSPSGSTARSTADGPPRRPSSRPSTGSFAAADGWYVLNLREARWRDGPGCPRSASPRARRRSRNSGSTSTCSRRGRRWRCTTGRQTRRPSSCSPASRC